MIICSFDSYVTKSDIIAAKIPGCAFLRFVVATVSHSIAVEVAGFRTARAHPHLRRSAWRWREIVIDAAIFNLQNAIRVERPETK